MAITKVTKCDAQELSPSVFGSLVDEDEYCVKFDEDTLRNVKSTRDGQRYRIASFNLTWIKLSDVPKVVDRYSGSVYQNKTPAKLHAMNQLVTKQRKYIAMLESRKSQYLKSGQIGIDIYWKKLLKKALRMDAS